MACSDDDMDTSYDELLFDYMEHRSGKCSGCEKDDENCLFCIHASCNYLFCKTCYVEGKFGELDMHSFNSDLKDDFDVWMNSLAHVSLCAQTGFADCIDSRCRRFRDMTTHLKTCTDDISMCLRCKHTWIGMCAHSTHCNNRECGISYCRGITEFKRVMRN